MTLMELIEELSHVPILEFPNATTLNLATELVKRFQEALSQPPPVVVTASAAIEPPKRKRGRPLGSTAARR